MCGYLVSITKNFTKPSLWKNAFDSIQHRGPDNSKVKLYNQKLLKIKFGFHRLSIVDHNNRNSDQPFETKNSILVFNGEIYNYLSLKKKLIKRNVKFKTRSDTEVLLRYLEIFGIKKTLTDLEGMWSFVWFLKKENKMHLARDRYGEKPLYYYKDEEKCIIASEIKAILLLVNKKHKLNKVVANNFLKFGLINYDNKTLFSDIFQIPPSHYSTLNLNNQSNHNFYEYYKYKKQKEYLSIENSSALLRKNLTKSIISRIPNEVKYGVLVSGGIDSSINFSIIKELNKKKKINLFFAPSLDKSNKDNKNIKFLEKYYKVKTNKILLPKQNSLIFKYLKKLIWINDYPLGSIANINQYLMGLEAKKKKIKVFISGQGADELFFGYLKYYSFYIINLFKNKRLLNFFYNSFYLLKNKFFKQIKIYNALKYLNLNFIDKNKYLDKNYIQIPKDFKNFENLKKRSFDDMNKYSVPTLCHTEDRMYMASGIETRFPYLNKNIQNFSLKLPNSFKLSYGYTKYILRNAFKNQLNHKLLFRKDKEGFETGVDNFLKSNQSYIKKNILNKRSQIFTKKIIDIKFLEYFDNYYHSYIFRQKYDPQFIFTIISFEIWLCIFKKFLDINTK